MHIPQALSLDQNNVTLCLTKTNKKETTIERGNLCDDSEIPEWLQEFRENLVDDEIPVHGGSHASSSHEGFFRAHIQET